MPNEPRPSKPYLLGGLLDRASALIFGFIDRLARDARVAIVSVGVLSIVGCAAVAAIQGLPLPAVVDEFAYLLHADTFASGRVTNPPHPMWRHFQTLHVIQVPTYTAKYPPAQGLVLALGQLLGHPAIGLWVSVGLMSAAITWMLFAWLSARWAVLGGLLASIQMGTFSYWGQSYWGGAVAALGGALIFGAIRRLLTDPRPRHGLLLGLGLAILANSRPFEGLLASFAAGGFFLYGLLRNEASIPWRIFRCASPALLVIGITAAGMGYYNYRTTGEILRSPYQVYSAQYTRTPYFFFQRASGSVDSNFQYAELITYNEQYAIPTHSNVSRPWVFLASFIYKVSRYIVYFFGPGFFAFMTLKEALRDRWNKAGFIVTIGIVTMSSVFTTAHVHYIAPITCLFILIMTACLASLYRKEPPTGRRLAILIILLFLPFQLIDKDSPHRGHFARTRASVLERLLRQEGRDLVIVKYGAGHAFYNEWVHNKAQIDAAEVVWARDMGSNNQELIDYYGDRAIWYLTVDAETEVPARWAWAP